MKKILLLIPLLLLALAASAQRSTPQDSIDVLHYDIRLDLGTIAPKQVSGTASVDILLLQPINSLQLSLYADEVLSVTLNGDTLPVDFFHNTVSLTTAAFSAGDTLHLVLAYRSSGHVESYGWGGLHMDNAIYYNLGVAFYESPHSYGRTWFPSRDNFYDKSTFRFSFTAPQGWATLASGILLSSSANPDGTTTTVWTLDNPTPSYLVSFATAPMHIAQRSFQGLYGSYPAFLGFSQDSIVVARSFDLLDSVLPAYERAFGPYRWGRIGYVGTPKGSMEHVANIALYNDFMADPDGPGQITIAHEFAHAWFGNLLTCASIADMWINEGGASFCEEIATAADQGADSASRFYQTRLDEVIRTACIDDHDWRALFNPPDYYSYGTTVYYKGALVWHSLRGLLGDSLFYASMRQLFDQFAFQSLSSQQLCDTLSRISGTDLQPFFDFHVFSPGFVDYHVDLFQPEEYGATVRLRQLLTGTEVGPSSHWVPLAFYSSRNECCKVRMTFDGEQGEQHFDLPFMPAFVLIDPDHELSDAATDDFLIPGNLRKSPLTHFKYSLSSPSAPPFLQVSHHYGNLVDNPPAGVLRTANRYWVLDGFFPSDASLTGKFYFARSGITRVDFPYIDNGFIFRNSADSLRVLYRRHQGDPWHILATQVYLSNNSSDGYCSSSNLQLGEYTLAVVDTTLADIVSPSLDPRRSASEAPSLSITPNPNTHSFRFFVNGATGPFSLSITDLQGRSLLHLHNLPNDSLVPHNLPKGNYLLTIQNNYVSLQSQMIVQ